MYVCYSKSGYGKRYKTVKISDFNIIIDVGFIWILGRNNTYICTFMFVGELRNTIYVSVLFGVGKRLGRFERQHCAYASVYVEKTSDFCFKKKQDKEVLICCLQTAEFQ